MESGGTTTESGIYYQNSVAALYLGRLCDTRSRPFDQHITMVRVEAPEHVDDIVITFADEHKLYIQAKENIEMGDRAWKKVWQDFSEQYASIGFQKGRDYLLLQIGCLKVKFDNLSELCKRANGENYEEWQKRLSIKHTKILEEIKLVLPPEFLEADVLFQFIKSVQVQAWTLQHIEDDLVPVWMPESNKLPTELFRLLRDRVGEKARVRGIFKAFELSESLRAESPNLAFVKPTDIETLRNIIKGCGSLLDQHKYTIGNTSIYIRRAVTDEIVNWVVKESDDTKNIGMLVDQAGMGKTVVMRDVLKELQKQGIDVLAIKADQQLSGVKSIGEIQERLVFSSPIESIITRLAELGRVAILVDQIDALSLSLAHDQRTLDVVLEFVARLRQIPNTRILLSCRLFDRNSDPRLKHIELSQQFRLKDLTDDEISNALENLSCNYKTLNQSTQTLIKNPLHLHLFALALETNAEIHGFSSLQELYSVLWQNVIMRVEQNAPALGSRKEAIDVLTDYMAKEQITSAPMTLLIGENHLEEAARWLASVGILIQSKMDWVFLHQTFFDYCYARQFVERNQDIFDILLSSDQGLFMRSQLVQIISYLRGTRPKLYIRDLQRLLSASNLRYHLRSLLLHWFGSLPNPNEDEWVIAQRMFVDPTKRYKLLTTMYGNAGWFFLLQDTLLPDWLSKEDEVETQLLPYLISMIDIAQEQVIGLIKPFFNRSEQWNKRIYGVVSRTSRWYANETFELYEQIIQQISDLNKLDLYHIGIVAKANPNTGCRLIRFVLEWAFERYMSNKQENQSQSALFGSTLYQELALLENNELEDAIQLVSQAEPKLFSETMLPWLEKVLHERDSISNANQFSFAWDELSGDWYEDNIRIRNTFVHGLITAVVKLTEIDNCLFHQIVIRLENLPYLTAQELLTHVYRQIPETHAADALTFLLGDQRRLRLGSDQYESRQLIRAIYPYLDEMSRSKLENFILAYSPIYKYRGVDGLRRRGIEQLRLLLSIPADYLSPMGRKQLDELERKFPNLKISETPTKRVQVGFVGSPISEDRARKMSNKSWLRAMQKYKSGVQHPDFLKGGSWQLSSVLSKSIKEEPERFYSLLQKAPDDIDDSYVSAFLSAFAESNTPNEWLFYVIRRFAFQSGRNIKRPIAWALEKRVCSDFPEDLIDILNTDVHQVPGEDEWWWSKGENHGNVYDSYVNSDRGSVFDVLMRVYDRMGNDKLEHKWNLIEFASADPSTALRTGAIHELTYMITHNRERAIALFEQLISGHDVLYESPITREFIYWAFCKNFLKLKPYMSTMMFHNSENVQTQGAQLACIAGISTGAMENEDAKTQAQSLADTVMTGGLPWKRGAASVYSRNITGSADLCIPKIISLLDEEDDQIQRNIDFIFRDLGNDDFTKLRELIEKYASSSKKIGHMFVESLSKNGLLDPVWTLSIICAILDNPYWQKMNPWESSAEETIRLLLRLYTYPAIEDWESEGGAQTLRTCAMDIFDLLMKQYSGFAQKVLVEWDRI